MFFHLSHSHLIYCSCFIRATRITKQNWEFLCKCYPIYTQAENLHWRNQCTLYVGLYTQGSVSDFHVSRGFLKLQSEFETSNTTNFLCIYAKEIIQFIYADAYTSLTIWNLERHSRVEFSNGRPIKKYAPEASLWQRHKGKCDISQRESINKGPKKERGIEKGEEILWK